MQGPRVAADRFRGDGQAQHPKIRRSGRRGDRQLSPDAAEHRGAFPWRGINIEEGTEPHYRTQARSLAADRGKAVAQALRDVGDTRPPVQSERFDTPVFGVLQGAQEELAFSGVFRHIGCELGHDDRDLLDSLLIEAQIPGQRSRNAPGFADLARFLDWQAMHDLHIHRTMVTRVPSPGTDQMSNSLTRRLEPPSPRPRPLPVV